MQTNATQSMSFRHHSARRRLRFEQLESRRFLAVTTVLANDSLTVWGDADADDFAVVGTANPGEITVTGRNGTTVNGVADGSTTIGGVLANLNVFPGDGNNVFSLDNLYIANNITIITGNGDDTMVLGATGVVSPAQNLWIDTSGGNDAVQIDTDAYHTFVGGASTIDTGPGHDRVSMFGASGGLTSVRVGGGDNQVLINGVTSTGELQVTSGFGNNSIAILSSSASLKMEVTFNVESAGGVFTTVYLDTVHSLQGVVVQDANPSVNFGPSSISVFRADTRGLSVATGQGYDTLRIYGNVIATGGIVGNLTLSTRGGDDNVDVSYSIALQDHFAQLGEGNDFLSMTGNQVTRFASFDGNEGTNWLRLTGNQFGALWTSGFATV
jgi:hypothetical protein